MSAFHSDGARCNGLTRSTSFGAFYFVVKTPKLVIVAILSLVTAILIVGYELQVQVIGVEAAMSNGQPAYPTYELAPYRLATVAGGIAIALYVKPPMLCLMYCSLITLIF